MNALEILETVTTALLKQNKQSKKAITSSDGICAYRGDNGLKCAIGHLIKDENYNPELEGKGVSNIDVQKALFKNGINIYNLDVETLLFGLQNIHDYYGVDKWPYLLEELKQKLIAKLAS